MKTIRNDFSIFKEQSREQPFVFLDNAAASQMPQQVIDAVREYYSSYKANVHSGIYAIGARAVEQYDEARSSVARFLNASPEEIIFTSGTTASLNMLARMLENEIQEGDEIIVSAMEHHSNFIPWQELAHRRGAEFIVLPIEKDGTLSLETVRNAVTKNTKIFALAHVSHVTGVINPIQEIANITQNVGALFVVDAAQSVSHMPVDVRSINCDFLAFSGQKMLGPTGIGVLYGKRKLLEKLQPSVFGGGMVRTVEHKKSTWAALPHTFEAGTPHIAGAIGLGSAIQYIEEHGGAKRIHAHERVLAEKARNALSSMPDVTVYGSMEKEAGGIISCTMRDIHPHDVAEILSRRNIAVRAGHHCALPLMRHFGVSGTVRLSLYLYNTDEDIDRFIKGIEECRTVFKR